MGPVLLNDQTTPRRALLVLAAEPAASRAAQVLQSQLGARVETTEDSAHALEALRYGDFAVAVVEETLLRGKPELADQIYEASPTAVVVEVNFAICSADRTAREVRRALARQAQIAARTRASAALALRNDLNGALTGLLLESELALRAAGPELKPGLQRMVGLVNGMRDLLGAGQRSPAPEDLGITGDLLPPSLQAPVPSPGQ